MPNYVYKGFKIHYEIPHDKTINNLYEAYGYFLTNKHDKPAMLPRFHTIDASKVEVRHQIKKIIEDYIDFEWGKYVEMKEEK